jgi:hypothetical protein
MTFDQTYFKSATDGVGRNFPISSVSIFTRVDVDVDLGFVFPFFFFSVFTSRIGKMQLLWRLMAQYLHSTTLTHRGSLVPVL